MDKFITWIDERLPVSNFVKNHLSQYYAPKNFNFFYYFGAWAIFIFILASCSHYRGSFSTKSFIVSLEEVKDKYHFPNLQSFVLAESSNPYLSIPVITASEVSVALLIVLQYRISASE